MSILANQLFHQSWFQKHPDIHPDLPISEITTQVNTKTVNKDGHTYFPVSCHKSLSGLQRLVRIIAAFAATILTAFIIGLLIPGVRKLWNEGVSGKEKVEVFFEVDLWRDPKNVLPKINSFPTNVSVKNTIINPVDSLANISMISDVHIENLQKSPDSILELIWLRSVRSMKIPTDEVNQQELIASIRYIMINDRSKFLEFMNFLEEELHKLQAETKRAALGPESMRLRNLHIDFANVFGSLEAISKTIALIL